MSFTERSKWGVVWLGLCVYFGVAETVALRSKHPDAPLSAHLRYAFGVHRQSKLGQLAFLVVFGWLATHLWKHDAHTR